MTMADPSAAGAAESAAKRKAALLTLAALGIVFGDIGTSPLYAIRECFGGVHGVGLSAENIIGVLSLIVWSLIFVISIKYQGVILRMDNRGEGGILALMALVAPERHKPVPRDLRIFILMGLFGAALLYADGILTPAISVLSAVEGLVVLTPVLEPYIKLVTVVILVALFGVQRHGTARVGAVFGPITFVWFCVISLLGVVQIVQAPQVFHAFNPIHGIEFFVRNGFHGFLVLGAVFLVVTGGEALYADLGHFGRRPIRAGWFGIVLPALLLNYFGQGALLLRNPEAIRNPFYALAPSWALVPLIALATAATVIASQALISGAFSLGMQAVQMGYSPRIEIKYTSETEAGQIYLPLINWALMIACIGVVLGFGSSSNLAAAYGISITATMLITTLLFMAVARRRWNWGWPLTLAVGLPFLFVDTAFLGANFLKIMHGGWFPLAVAAVVFTLMTTWWKGRRILGERLMPSILPVDLFLEDVKANPPLRVPGTAVYMAGNRDGTPPALLHNLKHNKVLHERVIFLTVQNSPVPHVPASERLAVENLGESIYRIVAAFGFNETANVPELLCCTEGLGGPVQVENTTFFIGRETVLSVRKKGMAPWRQRLFGWMSRNARSAVDFFGLPPNRVVELGTQVEL